MTPQNQGGRGTNQYGVKGTSKVDPTIDAAVMNNARQLLDLADQQDRNEVGSHASLADGALIQRPTSELVVRMSDAVTSHMDMLMDQSHVPTDAEITAKINEAAQLEDAILTQHPNVYGAALTSSVWLATDPTTTEAEHAAHTRLVNGVGKETDPEDLSRAIMAVMERDDRCQDPSESRLLGPAADYAAASVTWLTTNDPSHQAIASEAHSKMEQVLLDRTRGEKG